jgi:hypothetical protein
MAAVIGLDAELRADACGCGARFASPQLERAFLCDALRGGAAWRAALLTLLAVVAAALLAFATFHAAPVLRRGPLVGAIGIALSAALASLLARASAAPRDLPDTAGAALIGSRAWLCALTAAAWSGLVFVAAPLGPLYEPPSHALTPLGEALFAAWLASVPAMFAAPPLAHAAGLALVAPGALVLGRALAPAMPRPLAIAALWLTACCLTAAWRERNARETFLLSAQHRDWTLFLSARAASWADTQGGGSGDGDDDEERAARPRRAAGGMSLAKPSPALPAGRAATAGNMGRAD